MPSIIAQTHFPLCQADAAESIDKPDHVFNLHCSVLQKFAVTNPPMLPNAKVDAVHTRVGWRKNSSGSADAVVQMRIVELKGADSGEWVRANYDNPDHRDAVADLDLGPWLREQDECVRQLIQHATIADTPEPTLPPNQVRRFVFPVEVEGAGLREDAMNVHCAVLQRFVLQQPPVCTGAQIDPSATKIGWRWFAEGVQLVVELRIFALDTTAHAQAIDKPQWVTTNFELREHRALADRLHLDTWLRFQDQRARKWISDKAAQKKEEKHVYPQH